MKRDSVLLRLLSLVRPFKAVIMSILLGLATVFSGVGLMATGAWLIAAAAMQPPLGMLQLSIVGVRFFGIARGAFRYAERLASHDTTFRVLSRLRVWFYSALIPLAPARLQSYHSGDLLTRILDDIRSLENFFVRTMAPTGVAILPALLLSITLGWGHLALGMAWFICFALAGIGLPLWGHHAARDSGPRAIQQRAELNQSLVDGIQGLPDLLTLGQAKKHMQLVEHLGQTLVETQRRLVTLEGLQMSGLVLLPGLGMLAVLTLGIPLVRAAQLSGKIWIALVMAAWSGFEVVQPLPTAAAHLKENLAAAKRLFSLADLPPAVSRPVSPPPLLHVDLCVRRIHFRYDTSQNWILEDVSFDLPAGKHLAIVGPSGAGKSTLIRLLLRFWEYEQGHIMLGEHELREYDPADVRRAIAVVTQSPFLFTGTIRENLRLARPDANEAMLRAAIERCRLTEFIHHLPNGCDTWIGEQGAHLSGGEQQRLALARAILRDTPLLLFDEPAANLDTLSETTLVRDLLAAAQGRSLIWITHRTTALPKMDEILVLRHGRVAERGTHEQLLAQRGLYHWMFGRVGLCPPLVRNACQAHSLTYH